ncbi:major facilitator superfamily transporter [Talaromyces proteolyticus]|uniref:Major facilitator superfamily transporter n=1 Tax=Talaromyces proteolyticus TaxID=1131652 RepID=A0AAD4KLG8_9EURO|nr:major facilitator superfamily transporter [Talaromyces proteolyticus]KAH8693846.1 major facilitator superfamily transporter [Talaromyces proteolyticus]
MSAWEVFLVWFALALSNLCVFLDEGIISTAIPRITDKFHSLGDVGWYGSAYNITLCSFQLVYGRLFNEFPLKVTFLAALAIFEIGSLVCATSPNSVAFIIGRAIAGLGAAGLQSGNFALLAAALPPKKLPLYLGALGMVYGIGAVLGPVIGGIITNSYLTWRWCFYINLPIAAPTAVATIFLIKVPPTDKGNKPLLEKIYNLDPLAVVILLPCIISLILALQFGGSQYSWDDGRTIGCFVAFGVLLLVFLAEQWWMGDRALVPPRLVRNPVVLFGALYAFCFDSAFYSLVYYVPLWFQAVEGVSAEESGIRYLALVLSLVVTIFLGGWAVTKVGYFQPFMLLGSALLATGAGLLSTLVPSSGKGRWIPYQMLAGLGIGIATQQAVVAIQALLSGEDVNIGIALAIFTQCFGPTVFITVSQAVFEGTLTNGLNNHLPGLVSPSQIKNLGATELRDLVSPVQFPILLEVYNYALSRTYLTASIMAALSGPLVFCMGWRKLPSPEELGEDQGGNTEANSDGGETSLKSETAKEATSITVP